MLTWWCFITQLKIRAQKQYLAYLTNQSWIKNTEHVALTCSCKKNSLYVLFCLFLFLFFLFYLASNLIFYLQCIMGHIWILSLEVVFFTFLFLYRRFVYLLMIKIFQPCMISDIYWLNKSRKQIQPIHKMSLCLKKQQVKKYDKLYKQKWNEEYIEIKYMIKTLLGPLAKL